LNPALASAIVDCLRADRFPDNTLSEIKQFSRREWNRTLFWLNGSGLSHYFLTRLLDSGSERAVPPEIVAYLARNFAQNQRRVDAMGREFAYLNQRLTDAGVEFAAVKGFELAPDYCPNLSLRSWYSHDYLVSHACFPHAGRVLEQAGYSIRRRGAKGEVVFSIQPLVTPAHMETCYTEEFPRMVVLHQSMWSSEHSKVRVSPPPDALLRRHQRSWQNISFSALADEDALVFLTLDTFEHVLGYWCKLSWFFEIANFLRIKAQDPEFWQRFYNRIDQSGKLPEIAGLVFLLASRLFHVELPSAIRLQVSNLRRPLAMWVEHYGWKWAGAKYPGSKLSLFLQRELIDDPVAWEELSQQRLFLVHRLQRIAKPATSIPSEATVNRRNWRSALKRMKFHGLTTYRYAMEVPRWKRLLAEGR